MKKIRLAAIAAALSLFLSLAGCAGFVIRELPVSVSEPPAEKTTPIPFPVSTPTPVPEPIDPVRRQLDSMSLEKRICQLFLVSPEAITDSHEYHTALDDTLSGELERYPVGGLILFSGNLLSPDQTRGLISDIRAKVTDTCGSFPLFAVDEEGGIVARVASNREFGVKNVGNMRDIGKIGNPGKAYDAAAYIASYISSLGFNVDFAPVADVLSNPKNTVVKQRSFGSDPRTVSQMVLAQLDAFRAYSIAACPKHFPGHGATGGDTHSGTAYVDKTWDELLQCELIPFIDSINAGAPLVMVGHFAIPQVTGSYTPCSLSYTVITEKLRNELGFEGIVITDDLSMAAVTLGYSPAEAAVEALKAGVDILLMTDDFHAAYSGVLSAVKNGEITEDRLNESVYRILSLKAALG